MALVLEAILALILLIIFYFKYSFQYWSKLKVPYALPCIPWGNYPSPILRKENFGQVITDLYEKMRKKGYKYFGIYFFCHPCFVAADPEYVRIFLAKEFSKFSYRNFYYNEKDDPISAHLIALNGPKWRNLRNKLTPIFSTGKIKSVFRIFTQCGKIFDETLATHCEDKTPFDVKTMFASFSSDVIVNCAFGLEVDMFRKKEFAEYSAKAINFDMVRSFVIYLGAAFPELCRKLGFRQIVKPAADFFVKVVADTVEYREKNNFVRNDFLQLLINLKHERKKMGEDFTIGEMAAQCFIFFLAGYETSAATMSFALYEIAANPHVYDKLKTEITETLTKHNGEISYESIKDMTYLEQVVQETLRLHPAVYFITRQCTSDFYLEKEQIWFRKGSSVLIPIRGLHRDPELYPDPLKFDPDRFHPSNRHKINQYSFLPFGEGPRICIGQRFAIMEIKTALAMVLQKYKFKVNPKTTTPFIPKQSSLIFDAEGGIWLNCEKCV